MDYMNNLAVLQKNPFAIKAFLLSVCNQSIRIYIRQSLQTSIKSLLKFLIRLLFSRLRIDSRPFLNALPKIISLSIMHGITSPLAVMQILLEKQLCPFFIF